MVIKEPDTYLVNNLVTDSDKLLQSLVIKEPETYILNNLLTDSDKLLQSLVIIKEPLTPDTITIMRNDRIVETCSIKDSVITCKQE